MKPRKDQTKEQRIMRDMGALIISKLPDGADKSLALRMFWRKYPYGYANYNSFYKNLLRLASKTVISYRKGKRF